MSSAADLGREECGHRPDGRNWPVCYLPVGHAGDHLSADMRWTDTDGPVNRQLTMDEPG